MSEYDEREPAAAQQRPEPDDTRPIGVAGGSVDGGGGADEAEATQPVSQQPDPVAAQATGWPAPPEAPGTSYDQVQRGPDPYAWPQQSSPPPAYPTWPYPQGYPPAGGQPGPTSHAARPAPVPGWLWPVVAGLALMVGLLGGTLGGVAVSRSLGDGSVDVPILDPDQAAPAPLDPDNGSIAAVADELLPSTVQVLARGGSDGEQGGGSTGSGFVLDREGHVITNNHVVAGATESGAISVVDHKGKSHDATIVGRSPVYDIAVLQVEGAEALRPAALGSSRSMRVGQAVVAIGSPLGLSSTVTSGIVSALDRPVTTGSNGSDAESSFINAVQTDAAINPGNSGGPLVNMRGQVVGVNSAIATTGGGLLGGEAGNIGVGFAIPMEQVRVTAAQILRTGEARYPVIGASVDTRPAQDGAEVVRVPSGTPASRAGLRQGDVVVAVDGKPVTDGIELIVAIRSHQPGETITLTVERGEGREQVDIRLDSKVG
ncbi:MAG TPA: trypsin-like peptidase domain-containing protein [Nocardioides sp.]|nr:trypsin-like peptidase domain-containing protein [Nocardioides sp.]